MTDQINEQTIDIAEFRRALGAFVTGVTVVTTANAVNALINGMFFDSAGGPVNQSPTVAQWTYDFASVGMPVKVVTRS